MERINNWVAAVLSAEWGTAAVEFAERGAFQGYGTPPAWLLQSLRGGPKGSKCSTSGMSYHRIGYVHRGGRASGGRKGQERAKSRG